MSREEAQASQRAHAFAKAAGRQNRAVKEGFGVVDRRGNLTRIDGRTAGEHWPKVQTQLAGLDRAELLSVAAARAAMSDANRAAWAEQQRIDREKARPASFIEQKIINCENRARISGSVAERDGQTVTLHGAEALAAALDKAGIAVVRVTAADLPALDGLRRDEEFSRQAADTNREARKSRHFDKLEIGELAAVDKRGNVFKLNPYKLDLEDIEARLIDAAKSSSSAPAPASSSKLPSVIEARGAFEIKAEQTAALWDQRRADRQARNAMYAEARGRRDEIRQATAPVKSAVRGTVRTAERTLFKSASAGLGMAETLVKLAEKVLGIFELGFGASAPPTPEQAERNQRAAEEQHTDDEARAAHAESNENLDDLLRQIARDDAERLRSRRERGDGDEVERGREREP